MREYFIPEGQAVVNYPPGFDPENKYPLFVYVYVLPVLCSTISYSMAIILHHTNVLISFFF